MATRVEIAKLKNAVCESNSPTLQPLKRLFGLMDYFDDEYRARHDGKENPYSPFADSAQIEEVDE